MPTTRTFSAFTKNGASQGDMSQVNGIFYELKHGFDFFTQSSKQHTVYFSISGYRLHNTIGSSIGSEGFSWTAGPADPIKEAADALIHYETSIVFSYKYGWVNPKQTMNRGWGLGIRPVKDK